MNPSQSLMGLALGLLLAVAPAGAQPSIITWRIIKGNGHTFYITADELKALQPGQETRLYQKQDKSKPAASKLKKGADGKLYVVPPGQQPVAASDVTFKGAQSSGSGAGHPGAKKTTAAAKKPAAPRTPAPQGVSAEAWAVASADPALKGEERVAAARALEKLKAASPADFAAIQAAPQAAQRAAVKHVASLVGSGDVNVAAVHDAIGADLAAGAGAAGTKGQNGAAAPAGEAGTAGPRASNRGEDAIVVLRGLLESKDAKDAPARDAVAARISQFMLRRSPVPFIAPSYMDGAGKDAKLDERLAGAAIKPWFDAEIARNRDSTRIAELYYILGVDKGALPAWAKGHPSLAVMQDPTIDYRKLLTDKLEAGMKGWTAGGAAAAQDAATGRITPGAYAGAPVKVEDWAQAFLDAAAQTAKDAYEDPRVKKQIADSVAKNDQGGAAVDAGVPGSTRRNKFVESPAAGAGFDEMYVKGAKTIDVVLQPGTKPRRLSIQIVSHFDPGTKQMVDELGVYDITGTDGKGKVSAIYGRRFPLADADGTAPLKQGGYPYNLTMSVADGDRKIVFAGPDGQKVETSQSELLSMRRKKLEDAPSYTINGEKFRRIGQPPGFYNYWLLDPSGKVKDDSPTLSAAGVGDPATDSLGRPNPAGQAPLGFVGKGDKRQFYYNVWDDEAKMYTAKPCTDVPDSGANADNGHAKCDWVPPPTPPAPATGTTAPATTAPSTTAPATGTGTTGSAPTTPAGGGTTTNPTGTGTGETSGAAGTFSEACRIGASDLKIGDTPLALMSDAPWTFFLNPAGQPNGYYLCINGEARQTLYGDGIPVWQKTRKQGTDLILETVKLSGDPLDPESVKKGHVENDKYVVPGVANPPSIAERRIHYIALGKLDPATIKSRQDRVTVETYEYADYVLDLQTKEATDVVVPISETGTDPAKVRAAVAKAMSIGTAASSTFSKAKDKKSFDEIIEFVGAEVTKHDKDNSPMVDQPKIQLHLFVKTEKPSTSDPEIVAQIYARGYEYNKVNGKPNIAPYQDYDKLVYCYQTHKLERKSVHDKGH